MRPRIALVGVAGPAGMAMALLAASPASAHPMGNVSANEYVGLTLRPSRVDALAIVDVAEIPRCRTDRRWMPMATGR